MWRKGLRGVARGCVSKLTGRLDGEVEEIDEPSEHVGVDGLGEGIWLGLAGLAGLMRWVGWPGLAWPSTIFMDYESILIYS